MKRLIFALLLPLVAQAVELDGVVAKVGDETILKSDVIREMHRMNMPDGSRYIEIRNEMIERKLILKAAGEAKMTMQEWVVENRVREIINRAFDGDRNKLIEMLGKQKTSYPEWLARLKEDMIVGAMRWNVVDKNVIASPAAMQKEFNEHPDRYSTGHKVTVVVILLEPKDSARREEISEKLKTTDMMALGGHRYEDVNPDEMFKPEIAREISAMPKGTISHWINLDGWSYLLRKDAESQGKKLTFAEAYDHVEENVKEQEAKRLYTAWMERLRAETYIRVF